MKKNFFANLSNRTKVIVTITTLLGIGAAASAVIDTREINAIDAGEALIEDIGEGIEAAAETAGDALDTVAEF